MSARLSLRGLRAGVGVTSVLAGLGEALQQQGQSVLLVELSPDHLLGLHFNLPLEARGGWARAELDGGDWRDCAFAVGERLAILPYGRVDEDEVEEIERRLRAEPDLWGRRLRQLRPQPDWMLFDLPQRLPGHADAVADAIAVHVANVDPAAYALMQRGGGVRHLLVNRYDPAVPLQADLMQLWQQRFGQRLLPVRIHEDAAVPEALAMKLPLGAHASASLAAADLDSLAVWCLARAARHWGHGA